MALTLAPATITDASRIAAIHLAAFSTNAMLLAQFPTPAIRAALQTCLAQLIVDAVGASGQEVLVVRDGVKVIAFAKWDLAGLETEGEEPWWPKGTEIEVLRGWVERVESAQRRFLGVGGACHHLSFLATDPAEQGRGAASMLMRHAVERCKKENIPAYLESTMNASWLYRKFGFEELGRIEMALNGDGGEDRSIVYEEICFLFRPERVPI